ncbi:MAG: shc [Gammaproteobacteria bacterium]|nr:shc [Gammaproteobacteria bacterium]
MSRNSRALDAAANKHNSRQQLQAQKLERHAEHLSLNRSIDAARDELLNRQSEQGYWVFELEADCTIPAEYIMMMHYLDEIDSSLEARIAVYLRAHQAEHGGWPLYYGGELDISCTVKAYYALKLAGDSPDEPHMVRARKAILERGGAARANVFTRIALALFGQVPWRAVPYIPVEIMLMPRWFPFHLDKVSYWSRTVMVPLFILCTYKPKAKNPRNVDVRELFVTPPEREHTYFRLGPERSSTRAKVLARAFLVVDRVFRSLDFLIPKSMRAAATRRAESWFLARLNGEDGLGAIFPAMVNALEAMVLLGYPSDDPRVVTAKRALQKLLVVHDNSAYCQPCVSPVWDTALAGLALQEAGGMPAVAATDAALGWLKSKQLADEPGDWQVSRPHLQGGGWPFQFANGHYPDLDDTAVIVWAMHQANDPSRYAASIESALDWLAGMQSSDGGFAAFDVDNTHYNLNQIPFADHGALLDPPTSDVTARVVAAMSLVGRPQDREPLRRAIAFLRKEQMAEGPWFGRWGTNYIYGTWSVLAAFGQAGIGPDDEAVHRAVTWLIGRQNPDGGWGESNDGYACKQHLNEKTDSTPHQTAWALLGLMAVGEAGSVAVRCGIEYLLRTQQADGLWTDPHFTAPGFPRVFYLKYHGYCAYFPLWALSAYRNLVRPGAAHWH